NHSQTKRNKCTFLWFCLKRALGEPVTGLVLQAKAKQFHASLNVDSNFSATNEDDASVFREGLKAFLENHGYKLDNTYNGDETSLFWKHFPKLLCGKETEAPGRKASKDRVTI
ncbi:hypothetical protein NQ318_007703, partial [Aromia moschata]